MKIVKENITFILQNVGQLDKNYFWQNPSEKWFRLLRAVAKILFQFPHKNLGKYQKRLLHFSKNDIAKITPRHVGCGLQL